MNQRTEPLRPMSPMRGSLSAKNLRSRFDAEVSDEKAEGSAADGENDGFSEQRLDDSGAACAERRADGDLFAAAEYAREDEIGNVGAGDEQHEGDRSEHHQQRGTHIADEVFAHGDDDGAPAFVVGGIGLLEAVRDGVHLGLCLLESDAGFEAGDGEVSDVRRERRLLQR